MDEVFLVFQDGQEDPLCVCSSESVARQAILQIKAGDQVFLGHIVNTWFTPYTLLTNTLDAREYFKDEP